MDVLSSKRQGRNKSSRARDSKDAHLKTKTVSVFFSVAHLDISLASSCLLRAKAHHCSPPPTLLKERREPVPLAARPRQKPQEMNVDRRMPHRNTLEAEKYQAGREGPMVEFV